MKSEGISRAAVSWIRLNADTSRPWQRTGFHHPHLLPWVQAHRAEVLANIFTVVRGWYAAGQPVPAMPPPTLGSFEAWTQTLAGILAYADVPGFLGNLESQYNRPDADTQQWEAFFLAWAGEWAETPKTVREVIDDLLQLHSKLRAALPDYLADILDEKSGSARKRLGQALRQQVDVRQGDSGLYLTHAGKDRHTNTALWSVRGFPSVQKRPRQTPTPASSAAGEQHTPLPPTLPARVDDWPEDWRGAYEERAALLEEGGQLSRAEANQRAEHEIRQAYQKRLSATQQSSVQPMTDPQDPPRGETGTTPTPATTATPAPEPRSPVMENSQDMTTAESADTHATLPPNGQTDVSHLAADLGLDLDALSPRFGLNLRTLTHADAVIVKNRLLRTHREAFAQLSDGEEWALHVYLARCINVLFPSAGDHTAHEEQEL